MTSRVKFLPWNWRGSTESSQYDLLPMLDDFIQHDRARIIRVVVHRISTSVSECQGVCNVCIKPVASKQHATSGSSKIMIHFKGAVGAGGREGEGRTGSAIAGCVYGKQMSRRYVSEHNKRDEACR